MFYYIYFYLWNLILLSIICLIFSMFMKNKDLIMSLEWEIFEYDCIDFNMLIYMDWVTMLFLSIVFLITFMVMIYSINYMEGDKYIKGFFIMVFLFVMSMMLMLISPSILSILLGWDLLGMTSFCLVIFYSSSVSNNSGMITFIVNRIGDVIMLLNMGFLLKYGSGKLFIWLDLDKMFLLMVLFISITKSAQIPFSVWLPKAMAAPTPVSSLVHSSTLVTAGVYLDYRFSIMVNFWGDLLIFLSLLTMLMSGVMAFMDMDLKKIIAYSTLSQLGLMMMVLSLGLKYICMYHLLMHALFKSMLFMSVGIIIHSMGGIQDLRLMGNMILKMPMTMIFMNISNFSLCGIPFMSGFYSKDLIFEVVFMKNLNLFCMLMLMLGMMFTFLYTMRLMKYLILFPNSKVLIYINESKGMLFSMIILSLLSIFGGSMFNWLFFFDLTLIYLSVSFKLLIYLIFGMALMSLFIVNNELYFNNKFIKFILMMFNLEYMYMYVSKGILWSGMSCMKNYNDLLLGDQILLLLYSKINKMLMIIYNSIFSISINLFFFFFFFFFLYLCLFNM